MTSKLGPEPAGGITGYLAAEGFVTDLVTELGGVAEVHGRLVLAPGPPRPAAWAQNVWYEPRRIAIASVNEGARALRAIQRNWALYSVRHHRRAKLIESKLPPVSARPLRFPDPPPSAPLGSWTLLGPDEILASPRCSSPFVHGEARFVEDLEGPPNRAYLKLWEALTLLGKRPGPNQTCLELGASPGGWTWALQRLGATVIAIDKAPLASEVAALPGVRFLRQSAFDLRPDDFAEVDWLFSDVVCYPRRLLELVRAWLAAGVCSHLVCTVKFQGPTDHGAAAEFAAIPGSRLLHLHHNKHELTWMKG